ncbi:amino acid permease [Hazenella sp. IB182357]|uniref:Amino acid permease n=1 Tax=Polycladospora coralii TaxID=2771432 RepID=A0A926N9Q3_9BACL|nr:amino acid permease [Polycladospora coralii]MBD1371120.1 amino acid permease [Polycladospora coralii]
MRTLTWWQLSLLGVGCTIGTGFFLGSSIAIKKSGPAVFIPFLLAGIGTYIVYDALAKMSVNHPDPGSFRTYAQKAFGRWAGFGNGWMYLIAEMLIMGSQLIALAIFTRFWFPDVPLWLLATIYAILGLLLILTGLKGFEKAENLFGLLKTAAIMMFILIALAIWAGWIGDRTAVQMQSFDLSTIFSEGLKGVWLALLYAFYAFGGIEVMGLVVIDLKDRHEAPKAGRVMIWLLSILYLGSILLALILVSWTQISSKESPFTTALKSAKLPYVTDIFNGILIIAGFSTLVASLYAVVTILISLAEDKHAPATFAKKGKGKIPPTTFLFALCGLFVSIVIAFLLPNQIFEYMTTAAGLMLLYNWLFILFTYAKWMKLSKVEWLKVGVGTLLILVTVSGTLGEQASRYGFYVSLLFMAMVVVATGIRSKKLV